MRILLVILGIFAIGIAWAGDILPVKKWPDNITLGNTAIFRPSVAQCVQAGYRMLSDKPATPGGKRIVSEKIIQDPDKPEMCKYDIVYEDLPKPPPPEVMTNVPLARLVFECDTNTPGSAGWFTYDSKAGAVSKTNTPVGISKVLFVFSTNTGIFKGIKYK